MVRRSFDVSALTRLTVAMLLALFWSGAAAAGTSHVTFRYKIPAKVVRAFRADVQRQADDYGYPVHGCAYTHARKMYGCAVSAPGDWQILTRPRLHLYYEYIVQNNKVTQRIVLHHAP